MNQTEFKALATEWLANDKTKKQLEQRQKALKPKILGYMRQHNLDKAEGVQRITVQEGTTLDGDKLKELYANIWLECQKPKAGCEKLQAIK